MTSADISPDTEDTTDTPAAFRVPTPDERPLLYVWPEAASIFGMSRPTAYDYAQRGAFPVDAFKVGGRWRVRTADVRRFLGLDS